MSEEIQVPARVLALAEQVGDTPLAWKEHENGSITIVFNSKGKQHFALTEEVEEVLTVITTQAEQVETLPAKPERKEKRKR